MFDPRKSRRNDAVPERQMRSVLVALAGYTLLFAAAVAIVTLTHSQVPAPAADSVAPASEEASLPAATPRPVSTGGAALRRQPL